MDEYIHSGMTKTEESVSEPKTISVTSKHLITFLGKLLVLN